MIPETASAPEFHTDISITNNYDMTLDAPKLSIAIIYEDFWL